MEVKTGTSSDQFPMTTTTILNLRDLLKVRDEEEERNNSLQREFATVATILRCDKPDRSPSSSTPTASAVADDNNSTTAAPSRAKTILDIIRDEDDPPPTITVNCGPQQHQNGGRSRICWRSVRNGLRLCRVSSTWPRHTTSSLPINTSSTNNVVRGESTSPGRTVASVAEVETSTVIETGSSSERPVPEVQASTAAPSRRRTLMDDDDDDDQEPMTRISLMALLEQSDGVGNGGGINGAIASAMIDSTVVHKEEEEEEEEEESELTNGESTVAKDAGKRRRVCLCCVCMVRQKGAAFIPCGHTFCRPCSRELWVGRGNCPLCNGFILEILDIF